MKSPPPVAETENCARCPAFMAAAGTTLSMNGFSVIPSRVATQVADGVWNAVVTAFGRGTILIRRRAGLPASACPLRAHEIRMAGKAVGTGAGYELSARNQMKKLDADLKAERIDQKEYDIRKDQIERGSLVY